jgi:5-methylcytosine-specific restriction endonuclease McrA
VLSAPQPSRHMNGPGGRALGSDLLTGDGASGAATTRRSGLLARQASQVVDVQSAVKVSEERAFPHSVARILWVRPVDTALNLWSGTGRRQRGANVIRDDTRLDAIFRKTDGCCHICGAKLALSNYDNFGRKGAWEIEHSKPKAKGGTDHMNNLYPAHIACNRSKRHGSTRAARAQHGRKAAPLSLGKKAAIRRVNAGFGAAMAGAGAVLLGASAPLAAAVVLAGAVIGHRQEPDPQKGKRRRL